MAIFVILNFLNMKNSIFVAITCVILTSCASTRQFTKFTDGQPLESGMARVYVIKPSFAGAAVKVAIFCDDTLIGNARNGSYLAWDVAVGEHTIGNTQFVHAGNTLGSGSGSGEDLIRINAKDGATYYIKISPRLGGMDFKLLSKEEGARKIKGRKKTKQNYVE